MRNQQKLNFRNEMEAKGPVECLGKTFENDKARRAHFLGLLREKLQEPVFRTTPGFPTGSDEDILKMSDPPYYTACPNPFLKAFVDFYGKAYNSEKYFERDPFAVDVSEGKTDQLYTAHGYHTKVPYLAIVPSILHYTEPGEIVLDGFCGSGMTGIAAQWCGNAPLDYRHALESQWKTDGHVPPQWGTRRAILNDLGPAATFIAAGYNLPFDLSLFEREAHRILKELEIELGWMYATNHPGGQERGRINYTVWSQVFACSECGAEIVYFREALDVNSGRTRDAFSCPTCGTNLKKNRLERLFESELDPISRKPWKRIRVTPVLINYNMGAKTYEKEPDADDKEILEQIRALPLHQSIPNINFPIQEMYHGSRLAPKGFQCIHHLFLPRASQVLSSAWAKAQIVDCASARRALLWFFEQAISSMSMLNRYKPLQHGRTGGSQVNNQMSGIYYVASLIPECSPWYVLHDDTKRSTKLKRLVNSFASFTPSYGVSAVSTGDCASLEIGDATVDYIFTDPPFGENIFYADLNFVVEAWHGVFTQTETEAILDQPKQKGVREYQYLMRRCFEEYYRVLKPGRWMTVVFSNSSNSIWRAIQEAMGTAGFVVADVRTLDKKQGSYRQVTSSAVKQDLVISAYKPTDGLVKCFALGHTSADSAWAFVKEHLHKVPVFVGRSNEGEIVLERNPQILLDRMIAFHVQRGVSVPVSVPEFIQGLKQHFPERDGMYFLSDQVAEYDRKRTSVGALRQLSLFVNDEASAIQWVRQQLQDKPQSFQELQPQFMRELQAWAKHEQTVELKVILEQGFLHYDGYGPVPSQIHRYLSTNFKDLRNLKKDDPGLVEKARDRWYVPDPNKQVDLEHLRERALLKEFEEYKTSALRKLKTFRTEAVRVGFKTCWQDRDYVTIVKVAGKLPDVVLQEDEKLLMYYDNALTRLGDE